MVKRIEEVSERRQLQGQRKLRSMDSSSEAGANEADSGMNVQLTTYQSCRVDSCEHVRVLSCLTRRTRERLTHGRQLEDLDQ